LGLSFRIETSLTFFSARDESEPNEDEFDDYKEECAERHLAASKRGD
jgi:phage terminase Nu1 subunit (DNA packaging protein)